MDVFTMNESQRTPVNSPWRAPSLNDASEHTKDNHKLTLREKIELSIDSELRPKFTLNTPTPLAPNRRDRSKNFRPYKIGCRRPASASKHSTLSWSVWRSVDFLGMFRSGSSRRHILFFSFSPTRPSIFCCLFLATRPRSICAPVASGSTQMV